MLESAQSIDSSPFGRVTDAQWFALRTRLRQESVVAGVLADVGVSCYLPVKFEERKWSDRKKVVQVPLLSGYLFVQMDLRNESRIPVLRIPGVLSFVGNHGGPVAIPESQIANIRTVLIEHLECEVLPFVQQGDRVRVIHGPLKGIEGTMVSSYSKTRLIVSVDLIQKSLSISVAREDVEPIGYTSFDQAMI